MHSISDANELFNEDIFERYNKQPNVPSDTVNKVFDFDNIHADDELCIIKVPVDFDLKTLSGKSLSFGEKEDPIISSFDKEGTWEIASQPMSTSTNMSSFDILLPVKALDGAVALAPKKPTRTITVTRRATVADFVKKSQQLRDEPYVPPPQPKDLQMRFFPYGYHTAEDTDVSKEPIKELSGSLPTETSDKKTRDGSKKKKRKEPNAEEGATSEGKKKKKKKKGGKDQK